MAFTVLQHPGTTSGLYSPMWHVASSDNFATAGFRYRFDLYLGNSTTNEFITTLRVIPVDGLGVVDVSRIIRAYITNYFNPQLNLVMPRVMNTAAAGVEYGVKYYEEVTTGGITTPTGPLVTGWYKGLNAYNTPLPGPEPYKPLYDYDYKLLTSRDLNNVLMPKAGRVFLSFNNAGGSGQKPVGIQVQFLNADGALTGTIYSTSHLGVSEGDKPLQVFSLARTELDAAPWFAGTPNFDNAPYGYAVRVRDLSVSGAFASTPWAYVRFLCEARTPATAVHFLNRFGGFDTYYLTGPGRNELSIESKTFQRIPMISRSNTIREYDTQNDVFGDSFVPYHTDQVWTRKISSGYLRETDHNWLSQLLRSPQVYLTEGGYYYPVQILTKKWTQKLNRQDKMFNLELEINLGRALISQTR